MSILMVKTPDDVTREEAERERQEALSRTQFKPLISGLASHVQARWGEARRLKEMGVATRLEDCARRRAGEYSPSKLAQIKEFGGSSIFMNLTNVKCRAIESWLQDILCPAGDKPWGFVASPRADIPPHITAAIQQEMAIQAKQMTQQFQGVAPMSAVLERARHIEEAALRMVQKEANERARGMEKTVEDQLVDGGWSRAFFDFLYDITTYPSAVLKAPVMHAKRAMVWGQEQDESGNAVSWTPVVERVVRPEVERCSPFDDFPRGWCDSPGRRGYF